MARAEGAGIAAGRKRRRRIVAIATVLAGIGGIAGFAVGFYGHSGEVPAAVAIAGTVLVTVALTIGSFAYFRAVDELERRANYWSSTIGLYAYILAYLDWFLLWRGGVVGEPSHELLFAFTMFASAGAYLWRKFRP